MPTLHFTRNLQRHVAAASAELPGVTVADVLAGAFAANPRLRSYIVDDQGRLRKHVNVFVNGVPVSDRLKLSDAVASDDEIHVFQALSGG